MNHSASKRVGVPGHGAALKAFSAWECPPEQVQNCTCKNGSAAQLFYSPPPNSAQQLRISTNYTQSTPAHIIFTQPLHPMLVSGGSQTSMSLSLVSLWCPVCGVLLWLRGIPPSPLTHGVHLQQNLVFKGGAQQRFSTSSVAHPLCSLPVMDTWLCLLDSWLPLVLPTPSIMPPPPSKNAGTES